jgi:hypothetical protein
MPFREYINITPAWDKFLALMGVGSTGLSLTHINGTLSAVVALCTIGMLIPRMLMNWDERAEKREARMKERERLKKLEAILEPDDTDFEV